MKYNAKLSIPMTVALFIAGLTLCSVSIWYTIDLLRTLGADESEKWLMTVTAIGFEACKFAFIPIALALLSHKKGLQGTMVFFLGLALVGVSMVASLGFLAAKTDQGIEMARTESDEYKAGQSQLKNIDNSIALLSAAAAIDAQSQWKQARENAAKKVLTIEKLEEKRSRTVEAMKNIDAMNKTDTGALFIALANGWNMKAEDAKKLCYIVVALLLELCSIAALSLAGVGALKVSDKAPTSEKSPVPQKRSSSPSFFSWFSRSSASVKNATKSATAAAIEAPVASVAAAPRIRSAVETQPTSAAVAPGRASQQHSKIEAGQPILSMKQTLERAPVYDFTEYAVERKRVEQERQAAHQAKLEVLKAQKDLAIETKAISTEASKLREGVENQAAVLNHIAEQQAKSTSTPQKIKKQSVRKRSSQSPAKTRSAFDQDLLVRMQHEIKSGKVKGSIRSLQAAYNIGFAKGQMYHENLKELGIISATSVNRAARKA